MLFAFALVGWDAMELKSFGVKLKVECGLGGVREQGRFCISGIVGG